ncbi:MAG TPA: hypothetical protein VLT33_45270, partial [Labilithrix sp.]|nr:hypothetical protein [Labilithrix sp.]
GVTTVDVAVTKAPECAEPWLASSVLLTVASAHLECRVVVDGDRRSLELLGDAAVGSAEPEAIVDLLNEVVNNAGGNFMRAAYDEHLLVTTGLPSGLSIAHAERALEIADHTIVAWLSDPVSGAQLRVRLGVRIRRNAFVKVSSLREGMVLASDLRGAEGTVLLTAGTRVTSSTSERVRRMLDARRMVEVADTAA